VEVKRMVVLIYLRELAGWLVGWGINTQMDIS
jgi:hypothetical protein